MASVPGPRSARVATTIDGETAKAAGTGARAGARLANEGGVTVGAFIPASLAARVSTATPARRARALYRGRAGAVPARGRP